MYKQITLAAFLIVTSVLLLNAQPARNFDREMPEEHLEGTDATRAIARFGDLSAFSIRERLKQMREPAFQPTSDQINKIFESLDLPIAIYKRVDHLKAVLQPVFDYHERSRMQVYVMDSNLPKAFLIGRSVIIITTRMRLITRDQARSEIARRYWSD